MNSIAKHLVLTILCLSFTNVKAQDTIQKSARESKIEWLLDYKTKVESQEKEALKEEVETIMKRLENGEITSEKADELKLEAAKKHALNIENRLAIIDNQIAMLERTTNEEFEELQDSSDKMYSISLGGKDQFFKVKIPKDRPVKYDIRTGNNLLFAIGFNNAISNGVSLSDTPYEVGGSGFVELGWLWQTRLLKNSNFVRVNYGFSFQWNKLNLEDNLYFVENGDETVLEEFPTNLKKAKFRVTNLVIPVHFEFGPSKKIEKSDRIRFITSDQFKIGLGGYGGLRIATLQKLKYSEDGHNVKDKQKHDFNTSAVVYGISGYIGYGDWSLYAKYDLNPLFEDQAVDQHNISLGIRFQK